MTNRDHHHTMQADTVPTNTAPGLVNNQTLEGEAMPHADVVGQMTLNNFDKLSQYRSRVLTTLQPWTVKTIWLHAH